MNESETRSKIVSIVDKLDKSSTTDMLCKVVCSMCQQCGHYRRQWWLSVMGFSAVLALLVVLAWEWGVH